MADETDWNNYYGADGSLTYLKAEADKLHLCSVTADLAGGTRVLGTVYQNTSGKFRIVSVSAEGIDLGSPALSAYVELADASPDVLVQQVDCDDSTVSEFGQLCFVVPPNAYYTVPSGATLSLIYWYEWDLC
jgi:hypothetical protein